MIKTGADEYEGMIVGVLVVLAVAFNELREAGGGPRQAVLSRRAGRLAIVHPGDCWPATIATIIAGRERRRSPCCCVTLAVLGSSTRGAEPSRPPRRRCLAGADAP